MYFRTQTLYFVYFFLLLYCNEHAGNFDNYANDENRINQIIEVQCSSE